MAEKKATVPFSGTKEQEEALMKVIHELKDEKGALMPILQKAQDIYGYLPIEVQKMISDETGIPMEKITKKALPLIAAMFVAAIIITFIPKISLAILGL